MTFDFDLWPTDLNINRGHLLIKDYLPTKFEASGAKRSWVISCTRWSKLAWPLTLTFDLLTWISIGIIYSPRTIYLISCTRWSKLAWPLTLTFDLLTWKSIGIIYSQRTIYLPSLKLVGQSVLELSVAQGEVNWHDLWPWPLTYWPENQLGTSTYQGLSTYQVWSFSGKGFLSYQLHKDKGYRHTDRPTDRCKAICPPFSKGGGGGHKYDSPMSNGKNVMCKVEVFQM